MRRQTARTQVRQFLDDVQFEVTNQLTGADPRRPARAARRVHRPARRAAAHLHRRRQAGPGGRPADAGRAARQPGGPSSTSRLATLKQHRRDASPQERRDERTPTAGATRPTESPPGRWRWPAASRSSSAPPATQRGTRDPGAAQRPAAGRHRRPGQGRQVDAAQRARRRAAGADRRRRVHAASCRWYRKGIGYEVQRPAAGRRRPGARVQAATTGALDIELGEPDRARRRAGSTSAGRRRPSSR